MEAQPAYTVVQSEGEQWNLASGRLYHCSGRLPDEEGTKGKVLSKMMFCSGEGPVCLLKPQTGKAGRAEF